MYMSVSVASRFKTCMVIDSICLIRFFPNIVGMCTRRRVISRRCFVPNTITGGFNKCRTFLFLCPRRGLSQVLFLFCERQMVGDY